MSAKTYPRITRELTERFYAYYTTTGLSWGSLHVVLDDDNVQTHFVEFCRTWARKHDDPEGEELATLLLGLSESQRRRLGALASMPRFTTLESVRCPLGTLHVVENPEWLAQYRAPMVGEMIWLDGVRRVIRGVETHAIQGRHRMVGLVVYTNRQLREKLHERDRLSAIQRGRVTEGASWWTKQSTN